ncbi:MAG TPA: alanine--glyoxylate aminotransferase family protein, partial [Rhizobiales bacterium]|nr:alanine--glyoxylate aminotransferase family protein [Hyphomicrobiales bacterium]
EVYHADKCIIVPGGGTCAMEAVARQFAGGKKCMVLRNGWFSFRWSQIFDLGRIPNETIVLKATTTADAHQAPFAPAAIDDVISAIQRHKPDLVFAPHVETASGIMLPDDYVRAVGKAAREADALFVLDCIASGTIWIDMTALNVDVLISAPQKGWSASPGAGLVLLNERAIMQLESTTSSSFALDLRKWADIMAAYESGGHAYHATMPTDALVKFHGAMMETRALGLDRMRNAQLELGRQVRALLAGRGYKSVAAAGFEAPGVVVSYTDDPDIHSGAKFAAHGMQIAAGVPLQCDEPDDFMTFRIGLFGLDKLTNIDRTVSRLADIFRKIN